VIIILFNNLIMNYFVQGYAIDNPNIFREPRKMKEKDLEIFLNRIGLKEE